MIKLSVNSKDAFDFNAREKLNTDIWDGNVLKNEVRERLLEIAEEFVKFINVELEMSDIEDIIFTGSLANYNYTKFSDIDVHVLFNFKNFDENEELTKEYLMSKKYIWNTTHKILIKGYEVELYPQNTSEAHHSTGVYSIMNNEWIKKPLLPSDVWSKVNIEDIKNKYGEISTSIERLEESPNIDEIDELKRKIKRMRQGGLEKGGEYSTENLTFKVLRRTGYLGRLFKLRREEYDKQFSLKEALQKLINEKATDYVWGVKNVGRIANKFGGWVPIKARIKKRTK
tara:strand:- start:5938 stop:6792 length:855 start_codon:yes stop_codon:yes gene_type:complete